MTNFQELGDTTGWVVLYYNTTHTLIVIAIYRANSLEDSTSLDILILILIDRYRHPDDIDRTLHNAPIAVIFISTFQLCWHNWHIYEFYVPHLWTIGLG